MREIFLGNGFSVVELERNNSFEYYVTNINFGDLLFSFSCGERFDDISIINLYIDGYFDLEIEKFKNMV